MLWPILLILLSNTVYHICAKSTPGNVNAFGALMITYAVATIFTAIIFVLLVKPENVTTELSHVNWTSLVLGMVIVGLELGCIFAYRAGWKVSSASIVANIGVAIMLIFVGALLYGEHITLKQVMGIFICCAGLLLINMG